MASLALLTGACMAPIAAATAAPAPPGASYGLLASNANFIPGSSIAERAANYRRLYDAGVRVIRLDINWTQVEPVGAHGHYDFSERDREVQAIRQAGLKVIGILGYGHPDYSRVGGAISQTPLAGGLPPFSVGSANLVPPDNPADFARYARATAQHFAPDVVAWEVWNEENEGWRFWPPHEDPAAYARLLCTTYPAVKAVDPQATVLFGGVFYPAVAGLPGTSGPDFVSQTYGADAQVGGCFDALAYHPYPYPFTAPDLDVPVRGSVLSAADAMRSVLEAHGDGAKAVWITEVGWPTSSQSYGVPEQKQAQYLARTALATFAQGVPVLTWYTYGDAADPTGGANQEAAFGLFRADNSPKPAYAALRTFASVFTDTRFISDLSRPLGLPPGQQNLGGRGFALRYERRGEAVTALWLANESAGEGQGTAPGGGTAGPATIPVSLPAASGRVTVVDYLGARRTLTARGGRVALVVGPSPQYVIDDSPIYDPSFPGGIVPGGLGAGGGAAGPCAGACGRRGLASFPASRGCGSRRRLVVHLHTPAGMRVRSLTVAINGRVVRRVRDPHVGRSHRLPALVSLRGLPRAAVSVRVTVRGVRRGRAVTLRATRRYHPCTRARRGRRRRRK